MRWFRLLIHRYGEIPLALKLNYARKRMPAHPIHLREGMQIRNFLRGQPECAAWTQHQLEDQWRRIVERAVRAEFKQGEPMDYPFLSKLLDFAISELEKHDPFHTPGFVFALDAGLVHQVVMHDPSLGEQRPADYFHNFCIDRGLVAETHAAMGLFVMAGPSGGYVKFRRGDHYPHQPAPLLSYHEALHGIQTGIAMALERGDKCGTPKHLRVGIDSAKAEQAALARLLIRKGVITEEEYEREITIAINEELRRHEQSLSAQLGKEIKLR